MESNTLDAAIRAAPKDTEIRQRYFMDVITLSMASNRGTQRPNLTTTTSPAPPPSHASKQTKKKGKFKGPGGWQPQDASGSMKSPDGKFWIRDPGQPGKPQICMNYNRGRCLDPCTTHRQHSCAKCLQSHPYAECPKYDASSQLPSFKGAGKGKGKKK
jgi:hypothetical protein